MFYRFIFLILIASISMNFSNCDANKLLLEQLENECPRAREVSSLLREYRSKDQVYMMMDLYNNFSRPDIFPESEFDGIATRIGLPKRHNQSDKEGIGSFLFLTTALDDEHLLLVKQCFEPLKQLYGREDQDLHWRDGCTAVMTNIDHIVAEHPYFRHRYTLFALGAASKFDNKLARLILLSAVRHLILKPTDNVIIEREKAQILSMLQTDLNFADFYGILNTLPSVENLDEYHLPHSYVLRGRGEIVKGNGAAALMNFKTAEEKGDFEGCLAALPLTVDEEERQRLRFKAFWMGDESSYTNLPEEKRLKFQKSQKIFSLLKRFIAQQ